MARAEMSLIICHNASDMRANQCIPQFTASVCNKQPCTTSKTTAVYSTYCTYSLAREQQAPMRQTKTASRARSLPSQDEVPSSQLTAATKLHTHKASSSYASACGNWQRCLLSCLVTGVHAAYVVPGSFHSGCRFATQSCGPLIAKCTIVQCQDDRLTGNNVFQTCTQDQGYN